MDYDSKTIAVMSNIANDVDANKNIKKVR